MNYKKKVKAIFLIITCMSFFALYPKNFISLITIPKCGSNMLIKLVQQLTHLTIVGPKKHFLYDDAIIQDLFTKPIFLSAHVICIEENSKKIAREEVKKVFILRDPRDQIVSAAFWLKKIPWLPEAKWQISAIIDELISGGGPIWSKIFSSNEPWLNLTGITSFYNLYLPWIYEPNVYTTTFEKLIGSKGGGSDEEQLQEIMAIANHIGDPLDLNRAKAIAQRLFGGTSTFREGKIGSWKKYFLERHKIAFKKVAGQLLIDLGYETGLKW